MSAEIVLERNGASRITAEDLGVVWQITHSVKAAADDEWFSISAFRLEKAWLKKLTEAQK